MLEKFFKRNGAPLLADLVDTSTPVSVQREVEGILTMVYPGFDHAPLRKMHKDVVDLFEGHCPGYRACNTEYHDLRHTMDVFLTMARLIHGVHASGHTLGRHHAVLALYAALLHDTGYIQEEGDTEGTGGKYTPVHVARSVRFMEEYFSRNEFPNEEREKCRALIERTALDGPPNVTAQVDEEVDLLGKMLFASDLLGQVADRIYLEKLHFLYYELLEGGVTTFRDERDLMEKSLEFYEASARRLGQELRDIDRYMRNHFLERWDVDDDLYSTAINNNIAYLRYILENHEHDYRAQLRRGGIMKKLKETNP